MKISTIAALFLLGILMLNGCSEKADTASAQKSSEKVNNEKTKIVANNPNTESQTKAIAPVNAIANPHANLNIPMTAPTAASPANAAMSKGVAANVIHSGGYTYVEVSEKGKSTWIAGGQSPIKPGQEIYWGDAAVMNNFTSKSLDRTFPEILFVAKFITQRPAPPAPVASKASKGKVISSKTAAGYSYIEVQTGNEVIWIAAPEASVKANDNVSWNGATKMSNFTSKSLDKTFAEIFFVASVSVTQ